MAMILLYLSHTHSCDIKMPPLGEPKILCTSYSETASKEYRVSQKNWTKLGAIVVLADKLINIAPNFVQFFWDSLCSLYYWSVETGEEDNALSHLGCLWCPMLSMMRNLKPNGQSFSKIEVTNLSPFGFVDRCGGWCYWGGGYHWRQIRDN